MKREDRNQFLKIVQRQKEQEQEERVQMAQRRSAYLTYKQALNQQMSGNEQVR